MEKNSRSLNLDKLLGKIGCNVHLCHLLGRHYACKVQNIVLVTESRDTSPLEGVEECTRGKPFCRGCRTQYTFFFHIIQRY